MKFCSVPRFNKGLIAHIESETSGNFKNILVAVLKCTHPKASVDYDKDCEDLKAAMDGLGTNEKAIIQIVAGKTPQQIETLKAKYQEKYGEDLYARIDDETWDWGMSMFCGANFRACMLGLMREPTERLACAVRDCMVGWGTDDTGLITLLVHLSERQRNAGIWSPNIAISKMVGTSTKPSKLTRVVTTSGLCLPW